MQKHNDNQPISVLWEIGRIQAHCLIDSGCEGIMISPNFIRAAKIEPFLLDKPIGIQLAVTGSKSVINYGMNATIKCKGKESKEYFDIINIDYYDAILGTPFLRKHKVIINFVNNCLRLKDKIIHKQANGYKVGEGNPQKKNKELLLVMGDGVVVMDDSGMRCESKCAREQEEAGGSNSVGQNKKLVRTSVNSRKLAHHEQSG